MIIDFHTHVFPDAIAARTIHALRQKADIPAFTDGTLAGLKQSMAESGINISVVLPVVTKPSQFASVNRFAATITEKEGIISFGGIHPDTSNYKEELNTIKSLGLKGIKIHPDYQDCFIDDIRYLHILDFAFSIGLLTVTHAGVDVGFPEPAYCSPEKSAAVLKTLYGNSMPAQPQLILAHTGGWQSWDKVERHLIGLPVWMDISFSLGMISNEQMLRIVRNHGAERMLFATDSPWSGQKETLEQFRALPLTAEEQSMILHQNAEKLLGL